MEIIWKDTETGVLHGFQSKSMFYRQQLDCLGGFIFYDTHVVVCEPFKNFMWHITGNMDHSWCRQRKDTNTWEGETKVMLQKTLTWLHIHMIFLSPIVHPPPPPPLWLDTFFCPKHIKDVIIASVFLQDRGRGGQDPAFFLQDRPVWGLADACRHPKPGAPGKWGRHKQKRQFGFRVKFFKCLILQIFKYYKHK